jgi:hypothetical protein
VTDAPQLVPGDCIFFVRPTLRQALPFGWPGICAWLSGVCISRAQRRLCGNPQSHRDGFTDYSHVGIVVKWRGALALYEAVPGGVRLVPLEQAIANAHWTLQTMPLSDEYRAMFDERSVCYFIEEHSGDSYRWGGLPLAVADGVAGTVLSRTFRALLVLFIGYDPDNAEFCSELVAKLLSRLGIVPGALPVNRKGDVTIHDAACRFNPMHISPCEVARFPQLKRMQLRRIK